jgi:hypothetical protein
MFSPTFEAFPFYPYVFLHTSTLGFLCTLTVLPPFVPNDYLLSTHSDKVAKTSSPVTLEGGPEKAMIPNAIPEKWEVFAWALRDVMSKAGNLPKCDDQTQALRNNYKAILGYKSEKYRTKKD